MSTRYLFVDELAFISNRLRQVLHRHANQAVAQISFRDVQQVQKQIRTWDRDFVKPPMPLVAACNLEMLRDFYQQKLDFSIFQGFNLAEMEVIQEEIAAHAAREALDALIGYRLRACSSSRMARIPKGAPCRRVWGSFIGHGPMGTHTCTAPPPPSPETALHA